MTTASRSSKNPHVGLGIAIDLEKADGSRTLMVPSIKAADTLDFRQFVDAYQDLIVKARDGKFGVDDFAGTTVSLTNPGTIGTLQSVPRLDAGPRPDRRCGFDRIPHRVPGRRPVEARRARRVEGHHRHLDLRPPDHSGCRVRHVLEEGPRTSPRRGRLLRRRLPFARRAIRSGQVASRCQPARPGDRPA